MIGSSWWKRLTQWAGSILEDLVSAIASTDDPGGR